MDKLTFNLSKTQPVILTQVMIILNNLSRYHLSDITFLIEKFHIGMIVWLILNLLDQETVTIFSKLNQGVGYQQDKFKYVKHALEFVGNLSSTDQTLLLCKMLENGIIMKLVPLLEG